MPKYKTIKQLVTDYNLPKRSVGQPNTTLMGLTNSNNFHERKNKTNDKQDNPYRSAKSNVRIEKRTLMIINFRRKNKTQRLWRHCTMKLPPV